MILIFLFFILGLTFPFIYQIIEEISEIILTMLEFIKGIFTLKVLKINRQLKKMTSDDEDGGESTFAIGFQVPNDEEDEYEDEDL